MDVNTVGKSFFKRRFLRSKWWKKPESCTNTLGTAKTENELLALDFLENTLYFDRMVWFLVDGKLPELR